MPGDMFDPPQAQGDMFDTQPGAPVNPSLSWNYVKNAANRLGAGIGRGLGLPESLPTSTKELGDLADRMGKFDPSMLLGPGGPLVVGAIRNVIDAKRRINEGDVIGGGAQGITAGIGPLLGIPGLEEGDAVVPGLADQAPVHPSIKKLTEALPVPEKTVPRFQDAATTAIPALKEFESNKTPITLDNWHSAQDLAEAKRNDAAESFIAPARARGVQVDGNIIADQMEAAIPKAWATDPKYAQQYQTAMQEAQAYRRPMSIDENINGIKYNNSRLTPFYKANDDQRYAMQVGGFPIAELEAEARGRRQALAQAVDPEHQGQQFEQIRKEQSDLITFRQQAEAAENKLQKQYTPTTAQKIAEMGSDLGSIWHGNYRNVVASKMKQAPQVDKMFRDAFNNYDGPDLPETPTASPEKHQAIPPSRQLSPGAIQLPTSDTSGVRVTTGKPLEQSFQVHLRSPEERAQFIRQRNWNEVLADPKTLANESTEVGMHRMDLTPPAGNPSWQRQLGFDEQ